MINLLADAPNREARFSYIASIPWVTKIEIPKGRFTTWPTKCEAKTFNHKTCCYPAGWMVDDQRLYCWEHLFSSSLFSEGQAARTKAWMRAHPPSWRMVRS